MGQALQLYEVFLKIVMTLSVHRQMKRISFKKSPVGMMR